VAVADSATLPQDAPAVINVLGNDSDPDGDALTVSAVTQPAHGTNVINANGTVTYTPTRSEERREGKAYTISDGNGATASALVGLTVTHVNHPPIAVPDVATLPQDAPAVINVLGNDSDPDGDTLTVSAVTLPAYGTAVINANGTVTYTPT